MPQAHGPCTGHLERGPFHFDDLGHRRLCLRKSFGRRPVRSGEANGSRQPKGTILKKGSAGPSRRTALPFLIGAFWLSVGVRSQLRFTRNGKLLDEVRQLSVSEHAALTSR